MKINLTPHEYEYSEDYDYPYYVPVADVVEHLTDRSQEYYCHYILDKKDRLFCVYEYVLYEKADFRGKHGQKKIAPSYGVFWQVKKMTGLPLIFIPLFENFKL